MPIYEYACTTCHNRFERMRSMDAFDEPSPCPDCGTPSPRALSMFAAFVRSPGGELLPVGVTSGGDCVGDHDACGCAADVPFC